MVGEEDAGKRDAGLASRDRSSLALALAGPGTRGTRSPQTLRQAAIPGHEQPPPPAYKILQDITNMQIVQAAQVRAARPGPKRALRPEGRQAKKGVRTSGKQRQWGLMTVGRAGRDKDGPGSPWEGQER